MNLLTSIFQVGVPPGEGVDDTVSSLAAGTSATFSITGQISSDDPNGQILTGHAEVTASNARSAYATDVTVHGSNSPVF